MSVCWHKKLDLIQDVVIREAAVCIYQSICVCFSCAVVSVCLRSLINRHKSGLELL